MLPDRAQNLALLRRVYAGLESGNAEDVITTFAPSVVVHLRGVGELDGTYRGLAEARALYERVIAALGPNFLVPPYEVLVHDQTLVVVPKGSSFGDASRGLDVYHVEDGRFTEAWLTAWPPEA
jgi:hypothetical protein